MQTGCDGDNGDISCSGDTHTQTCTVHTHSPWQPGEKAQICCSSWAPAYLLLGSRSNLGSRQEGQSAPSDLGHGSGRGGTPRGTARNWGHRECAASPAHSDTMELLSPAPGRGCGARALGQAHCSEVPAVNVVAPVQMRETVL